MRRTILLFLLIISILALVGYSFFINSVGVPIGAGDFECRIYLDKTVKISYYKGTDDEVVIPESIDGYTVKAIGSGAFTKSTLKKVHIPSTVTDIDTLAFAECSSLETVVLEKGIKNIGPGAFYGCDNLTALALPEGLEKIDAAAFAGCTSLQSVLFPESLKTIGAGAFCYCSSLAELNLPSSLEVIEDLAFAACLSLESLYIPDSVSVLGNAAFGICPIKSVYIGAGVRDMESVAHPALDTVLQLVEYITELDLDLTAVASASPPSLLMPSNWIEAFEKTVFNGTEVTIPAFFGNVFLTDVIISDANKHYTAQDGVIFSKDMRRLVHAPAVFSASEYTGPNGVEVIGNFAFAISPLLERLYMPESVKMIGNAAFAVCPMLQQIHIPEGAYSISSFAFLACETLESVYLPSTLTKIGMGAFEACLLLSDVSYGGTQEAFFNIDIASMNSQLFASPIRFVIYEQGGYTH